MASHLFEPLKNANYARLYAAQTISQVGDALTWVGLALLAYHIAGGKDTATVLGMGLSIRVATFVLVSPLAGVLADRINRKWLLVGCNFGRMLVMVCMPFVEQIWQLYGLIFLLNLQTAFYTPTLQASIPLLVKPDQVNKAFALSSATSELIGILGPGLAGVLAGLIDGKNLFFIDAVSFLLSGILILGLPKLQAARSDLQNSTWQGIRDGSARLWRDRPIRFALLMELVAAISGALVLVQTVTRVRTNLELGETEFGWVMAAYGLGATLASVAIGQWGKHSSPTRFILWGALLTTFSVLLGDTASLYPMMALWLVAGVGQNWVNLPTETLLAERTESTALGRVYGAHFAWSHLWWAFAYPVAGFLGSNFPEQVFFYGGLLALLLLLSTYLVDRLTRVK
jgi:MFS transporter, NRE family, putaive nickel resistance protein